MKKFLALILALIMGLSLVACGGDKAAEAPADTKTEAPAESGDAAVEFEEMTWKFACSATENTCWADMAVTSARWSATLPAALLPLRFMLLTS